VRVQCSNAMALTLTLSRKRAREFDEIPNRHPTFFLSYYCLLPNAYCLFFALGPNGSG
jgi:hypothetical protein